MKQEKNMLVKRLSENPNLQTQLAILFWLNTHCVFGRDYYATNQELFEDFHHCVQHHDLFDLSDLKIGDFDKLLAHYNFNPVLDRHHITWRGMGLRFDYWDPEESESPFPSFPKIWKS